MASTISLLNADVVEKKQISFKTCGILLKKIGPRVNPRVQIDRLRFVSLVLGPICSITVRFTSFGSKLVVYGS